MVFLKKQGKLKEVSEEHVFFTVFTRNPFRSSLPKKQKVYEMPDTTNNYILSRENK